MEPKKTLSLPFILEGGGSKDLVSSLTVDVQAGQICADCLKENRRADDERGWLLVIEARSGDFTRLLSHLYCPECGRKRLAHLNRVKECDASFGNPASGSPADKMAESCVERKTEAEEGTEEDEDDFL